VGAVLVFGFEDDVGAEASVVVVAGEVVATCSVTGRGVGCGLEANKR
jgi:hypothetical protein